MEEFNYAEDPLFELELHVPETIKTYVKNMLDIY